MGKKSEDRLRRYTSVLSLLDIVHNKRLTLLPPTQWYDQNDAHCLREYARLKGAGTVYAACFAQGTEQAHHWQIFSGHAHGLCIQFDKEGLINHLNSIGSAIKHGPAIYKDIAQLRKSAPIDLEELPFLKRAAFEAENEYRIIGWKDELLSDSAFHIGMPLGLIRRITLGPSMPQELKRTLKDIINSFTDCEEIEFGASRMDNNILWAETVSEGIES